MYAEACEKYDIHPVIDMAASKINHVTEPYITKEDDLFTKQITVDAFLNPPYGRIKKKFIQYAYEQHQDNNISILMLIFSKTGNAWWHHYIEDKAEVHNIQGRIQFNDEHGNPKMVWDKKRQKWIRGVAPYDSCWAIYRSRK